MTLTTSGLTCVRRLGAGGEAEVFEVAERSGLAFKKYRKPTRERAAKLRVMLSAPPDGVDAGGHVAIAWPTELVVASGGSVEGFLMPRIDLAATVPLFQVYNPASRVVIAPAFTWRYLLRTARNVAAIVDSLHRAGYVVGDINESNLLVNRRALAVLVDCDSMQVRDPSTGEVHRGGVGKPEFTAPELHGHNLATTDRTAASDDFAVAVLVFQLLMEGVHPFAGIWSGKGEPPDVAVRIRAGHFAYRRRTRVTPPPRALALRVLPPELRRMMWRAFTTGIHRPRARPTAGEWAAALERADERLRTCARSPHHVFGTHRRRCPWCDRIDAGFPDPFPGPTGKSALTPRDPPWWVRARSRANSAASSILRRARRQISNAAKSCAAWCWSRIRGPLSAQVPAAGALVAGGALLPVIALLLTTADLAWRSARVRRRPSLTRVAREIGLPFAVSIGALTVLAQGAPPLRPTVATSAALVSVSAWLDRVPPMESGRWARLARYRPRVLWIGVVALVATLLIVGPVWWPAPD